MAKGFTLLTTNGASGSATSRATASINPASSSTVALYVAFRSADLASVASEVFSVSGCATTWTEIQRKNYDASSRMAGALFIGTGPFTNQAVTLSFVSARSCDRAGWVIAELSGADGPVSIVQSNSSAHVSNNTTISLSLSAFADANNWTCVFASGESAASTFGPEAGYETPLTTATTGVPKIGVTKTSEDTTPSLTRSGNMAAALFAFEYANTAGPTITVQPVADTVILSNETTASFSVTATGTGTLLYDWELETSVGGGVYANLADGSGATWTGQASASCSAALTAKTLTGRRVRCNVTDDNGTTTTDAVALTIWDGPTLTTFPATNGSGVSTATLTCDYVTGVGEAIEVRIPLSDGDVAVTVTTT